MNATRFILFSLSKMIDIGAQSDSVYIFGC